MILSPIIGVIGIAFALITFFVLMKKPEGSKLMIEISHEVHKGAMAFLAREYRVILIFVVVMFIVIAKFLSLETGIAYISGAVLSMLAGFIGMKASTRSSARTCEGARTKEPRKLLI